jgi:hypothetical protein
MGDSLSGQQWVSPPPSRCGDRRHRDGRVAPGRIAANQQWAPSLGCTIINCVIINYVIINYVIINYVISIASSITSSLRRCLAQWVVNGHSPTRTMTSIPSHPPPAFDASLTPRPNPAPLGFLSTPTPRQESSRSTPPPDDARMGVAPPSRRRASSSSSRCGGGTLASASPAGKRARRPVNRPLLPPDRVVREPTSMRLKSFEIACNTLSCENSALRKRYDDLRSLNIKLNQTVVDLTRRRTESLAARPPAARPTLLAARPPAARPALLAARPPAARPALLAARPPAARSSPLVARPPTARSSPLAARPSFHREAIEALLAAARK